MYLYILRKFEVDPVTGFGDMTVFVQMFQLSTLGSQNSLGS